MADSVCPSDRLLHAGIMSKLKTTPATIMQSSLQDSPMTLVFHTNSAIQQVIHAKHRKDLVLSSD